VFGRVEQAQVYTRRSDSQRYFWVMRVDGAGERCHSHATGLFQILYPSTWLTTSQASQSPYDAYASTLAAYQVFQRDGYSWRGWVCQL